MLPFHLYYTFRITLGHDVFLEQSIAYIDIATGHNT